MDSLELIERIGSGLSVNGFSQQTTLGIGLSGFGTDYPFNPCLKIR
jgi:hypothetical protein